MHSLSSHLVRSEIHHRVRGHYMMQDRQTERKNEKKIETMSLVRNLLVLITTITTRTVISMINIFSDYVNTHCTSGTYRRIM